MIFKEAVMKADRDKVKKVFMQLYPKYKHNIEGYMEVFDKLRNMLPEPEEEFKSIIILVDWIDPSVESDEGLSHIIEDEEGYYMVHGYEPGKEVFWAIQYSPWKNWLAWEADQRFIMMNGVERYVAHCLWEMTWTGFTEEEIEEEVNRINTSIEEAEKAIKEGREEAFITWDELKERLGLNDLE